METRNFYEANDTNYSYKVIRLLQRNPGKFVRTIDIANVLKVDKGQASGTMSHLARKYPIHQVRNQVSEAPRGLWYYGDKIDDESLIEQLDKWTGVVEDSPLGVVHGRYTGIAPLGREWTGRELHPEHLGFVGLRRLIPAPSLPPLARTSTQLRAASR